MLATLLSFSLKSSQDTAYKTIQDLPLSKNEKNKVMESEIIVNSDVTTKDKQQSMDFYIAGLHKKSCRHALRTLSRYEDFSKHITFVKSSQYNEGRIDLLLDSTLLPSKMRLNFQIPRITSPGSYPFMFDQGFFFFFHGTIHVIEHDTRCLFYTTANWSGPDTGYDDSLMEFFSSALSDVSMRALFLISTN